jgi:hypothetical protein
MLKYNIYYNNERLNKYPLSKEDIEQIQQQKYIGKVNDVTKEVTRIPTENVNIIKCYLV